MGDIVHVLFLTQEAAAGNEITKMTDQVMLDCEIGRCDQIGRRTFLLHLEAGKKHQAGSLANHGNYLFDKHYIPIYDYLQDTNFYNSNE